MRYNVNIETRLSTSRRAAREEINVRSITRGSSESFKYPLNSLDGIYQLTYSFSQPGGSDLISYKMYNYDNFGEPQLDGHFYYDEELKLLELRLSPEETVYFEPSNEVPDTPGLVLTEIAIEWDTKDEEGMNNKNVTAIIPQTPLIVFDSLFGQSLS